MSSNVTQEIPHVPYSAAPVYRCCKETNPDIVSRTPGDDCLECTDFVKHNQRLQLHWPGLSTITEQISASESETPQINCIHRGSKRRCCDQLYLCRKFPGESCTPGPSHAPDLRSCQDCDLFETANP